MNLTVLRSEQCGVCTPHEMALVAALVPHLQTGFAMLRELHRLKALSPASAHVLESLPLGIVLLDENAAAGAPVHSNANAKRHAA